MWSCVICQDSLSEKPEPNPASGVAPSQGHEVVTTLCGHLFHRSCILNWIASSEGRDCAFCKQKISVSTLIKIFPVSTEEDTSINMRSSSSSKGQGQQDPNARLKKQMDNLKSELDQYRKLSEETGSEAQHYRTAYESLLGQVFGDHKNNGAAAGAKPSGHGGGVTLIEGLSSAEVKCILADQQKEISRLREYSNFKDTMLKSAKERMELLGLGNNLGRITDGFLDITFS